MQRIPVQSSEIALVGYDSRKELLEIVFRRGGVYRYRGVPETVHQELLKSESLGTYFSENIKETFHYVKVA